MAGTLQFCFKRYEKKYMLTPQQLVQITAGIQAHMRPDEFGCYTICLSLMHI